MTNIEFKKLLSYLRCHPDKAIELATVLSGATGKATEIDVISYGERKKESSETSGCQWISAKKAGAEIGMSSTWVRRKYRRGLFRSARRDKNGRYLFLRSEIIKDYNEYVEKNSMPISGL
jgi:hypothetical protein